ncbi:hypothetical protein BE20_29880 [Sorangium cellulosum]|nr:hypothetical protein BE20_29880 [Sorangium cellulosum]
MLRIASAAPPPTFLGGGAAYPQLERDGAGGRALWERPAWLGAKGAPGRGRRGSSRDPLVRELHRARSEMPLPRISAAELMTENPRTVRVNDPIGEAVDVLQTTDFRHLPVVDEQGELVGMLSDRDLRALQLPYAEDAAVVDAALQKARMPVSTMMSSNVLSVGPDADVTELMELMLENKIGALPVVDGEGALLGIVSYVDIFRGILEEA